MMGSAHGRLALAIQQPWVGSSVAATKVETLHPVPPQLGNGAVEHSATADGGGGVPSGVMDGSWQPLLLHFSMQWLGQGRSSRCLARP